MKKTIEVSEETYNLMKEQFPELEMKEINDLSDFIGEKLLIRTVTYFALGRVKKVMGKILELEEASWVADTGEFTSCIKSGKINELEITGRHFLNFDSVVDFFIWKHELPKERK